MLHCSIGGSAIAGPGRNGTPRLDVEGYLPIPEVPRLGLELDRDSGMVFG